MFPEYFCLWSCITYVCVRMLYQIDHPFFYRFKLHTFPPHNPVIIDQLQFNLLIILHLGKREIYNMHSSVDSELPGFVASSHLYILHLVTPVCNLYLHRYFQFSSVSILQCRNGIGVY